MELRVRCGALKKISNEKSIIDVGSKKLKTKLTKEFN